MAIRNEWGSVCCESQRDREAVHSWFQRFVPKTWGLPLKCDLLEDAETGRTKKFRALYRTDEGRMQEAIRSHNKSGFLVTMRPASAAILKGCRAAERSEAGKPLDDATRASVSEGIAPNPPLQAKEADHG